MPARRSGNRYRGAGKEALTTATSIKYCWAYGLGQDLHHSQGHQQIGGRRCLAHNKTLAAQLYQSSSPFSFRRSGTVSYYDYYQPSVHAIERRHIEKATSTTSWISCGFRRRVTFRAARLRHRGQRELYLRSRFAGSLLRHTAHAGKGPKISRNRSSRLVDILYERNDHDFRRGTFACAGM